MRKVPIHIWKPFKTFLVDYGIAYIDLGKYVLADMSKDSLIGTSQNRISHTVSTQLNALTYQPRPKGLGQLRHFKNL